MNLANTEPALGLNDKGRVGWLVGLNAWGRVGREGRGEGERVGR